MRVRSEGYQGESTAMSSVQWAWDSRAHPEVMRVFEGPCPDLEWCGHLEKAPGDATVGKVLCVCAAMAIARKVLAADLAVANDRDEIAPLGLLGEWLDDPTEERFARICALIFDDGQPSLDPDPDGVVTWALRTATSSVGNGEAGSVVPTVIFRDIKS
jgi:hypothetical protein